ncbi:MAG TPA: hypothetical protein VGS22_28630 [Thermoanaerobaculia bacterium]|nr:hypothetical protein [Thermoanaerobaculia bacterium]
MSGRRFSIAFRTLSWALALLAVLPFLGLSGRAAAQCLLGTCTVQTLPGATAGVCGVNDEICIAGSPSNPSGCAGNGCNGLLNCRQPVIQGSFIEIVPGAGNTFNARLGIDVRAWWNVWAGLNNNNPNGRLGVQWTEGSAANPCASAQGFCQYLQSDHARCYIEKTGLTCGGAPYDLGVYSARASVCDGGFGSCFCAQNPQFCGCWRATDQNNLSFQVTPAMLGCPIPPPENCGEGGGDGGPGGPGDPLAGGGAGESPAAGAAGASCPKCVHGGAPPACSQGVAGRGPSCSPSGGGPKALLRYHAGSVGSPNFPGTSVWTPRLGRNWSHDFAERIVIDPDVNRAWLLTRHGTFREFRKTGGGAGTFAYPLANNTPSDE